MKDKQTGKAWLRKVMIIALWLFIWQICTMCIDNSILLVGPLETVKVLSGKLFQGVFWASVFSSMLRIMMGFAAGWIFGLLLAALSAGKKWVEEMLNPIMVLMKTVPVASFVVLFLIWFRSDVLSVAISFCVVFPNVYLNTLEGIRSADAKLLEMAKVYKVHLTDQFFYIYRPALKPFWVSCMKLSIGMSWKSGVAAEVIGTPDRSVGEQLYMSKIHFDTAGVLAWTAVIILVSVLCEKLILKAWDRFLEWQPGCRGVIPGCRSVVSEEKKGCIQEQAAVLLLTGVKKTYGEQIVLEGINEIYRKGEWYYFKTPSGSGKTTLFRLIAGIEQPEEGNIRRNSSVAYAFQEDRLCADYSAVKNLEMITGNVQKAREYLLPLLGEEDIEKPCRFLSGGMKRRVEVARAFAAEREIILLDEPFAGLDEENRVVMKQYIEKYGKDKTILIASHV